jgi:hypothetical protein
MLGHQLPALPPLDHFLVELPDLFAWLHGEAELPALAQPLLAPSPTRTCPGRCRRPRPPGGRACRWSPCALPPSTGSARHLPLTGPSAVSSPTHCGGRRMAIWCSTRSGSITRSTASTGSTASNGVTTKPFRPRYAVEFRLLTLAAPPVRRSAGYPCRAAPRDGRGVTARCTSCSALTAASSFGGRPRLGAEFAQVAAGLQLLGTERLSHTDRLRLNHLSCH